MADLAYVMLIRFLPNQKLVSGSFGIENGLNRYYTDIGFGAVFSEQISYKLDIMLYRRIGEYPSSLVYIAHDCLLGKYISFYLFE